PAGGVAIGHESDRPLCDEVADLRCGTPSMAAAAVVPDRAALASRLDGLLSLAGREVDDRTATAHRSLSAVEPAAALTTALATASARLSAGGRRFRDAHPRRALDECGRRLAAADWRRPTGEVLGRAAGRLEAGRRHLAALAPTRVLARGYAVVTGPDGTVVRDAASLEPGARLDIRVAAGRLGARVEDVRRG
ncbi:MAG TPA: exodeoxyribonuclease VII large subunit, partial [Acidimicrobiales bacterium]|nr:exodeoxyribonuclease VII large subunit [Acidimicrobiales bacterium]